MTFKSIRADALASHNARQHMYARGGEVHTDEAEDRALIKEMVKPKDLKKGERRVEGRARGGKMDRPGKAKTVVNVIVPPGGGGAPAMPPHPPVMVGPPPGPSMALPPPRPVMPPPQPGMGPMAGPPPGGMPPPGIMPRSKGGKVKHRDMGGAMPGQPMTPQQMQQMQAMRAPQAPMGAGQAVGPMKSGGRAERARGGGLDAGAGSGVGRIEKAKNGRPGPMLEYD